MARRSSGPLYRFAAIAALIAALIICAALLAQRRNPVHHTSVAHTLRVSRFLESQVVEDSTLKNLGDRIGSIQRDLMTILLDTTTDESYKVNAVEQLLGKAGEIGEQTARLDNNNQSKSVEYAQARYPEVFCSLDKVAARALYLSRTNPEFFKAYTRLNEALSGTSHPVAAKEGK